MNSGVTSEVGDTPHNRESIRITANDYTRLHQIMAHLMLRDNRAFSMHEIVSILIDNWASRTDNIE